jgi:hypothetical protein
MTVIYEKRTYAVKVGEMNEVKRLYGAEGWPALSAGGHDKHLIGYFTSDTGDWRADCRAFRSGEEETSIKKLITRFGSDDATQRALAREAEHFFGKLTFEEGIRDRDVQKEFLALREWVDSTLRSELQKLSNYEIDYADLVNQLESRALALSKLGRADLAALFKG